MESTNGDAHVYIDKDKLSAYIEIAPPSGDGIPCTLERVKKRLLEKNVVYNIDEDKIKKALDEKNWGKTFVIAQGVAVVHGIDAKIKYIKSSNTLAPAIKEDGRVDYRSLGIINNVSKGQLLAEKIPPVSGKAGKTVQGQDIKPRNGKDMVLPKGKNTVCNKENTKLYAAIDGHLKMNDNKFVVEAVFELPSDVDYSSGNIDFVGDVIIHGNIASGFSVKARGNIYVQGFIEGAEVIAGGNIEVKGGIKAGLKVLVKASKDILVRFVENAYLEAGNDIIVSEAIMHSHIKAGGNVIVKDKKAMIVGGVVQASNMVEARSIGSHLATQTIIEVGVNPYFRDEYQQLLKMKKIKKKSFDNLNHNLQLIQRSNVDPQDLPEKRREQLIKILDDYKKVHGELLECEERIRKLELEFEKAQHAKVRASEVVYPGVRVSIGSLIYIVNDLTQYAQFILEDGEVKLTTIK